MSLLAVRKLLLYFRRRHESRTLYLAQRQIAQSIGTVNVLNESLGALSKNDRRRAKDAMQSLFLQEDSIDKLRLLVFEELSADNIPGDYRESLKELIGYLDGLADHVKDAARSIKVLTNATVPRNLLEELVKMGQYLSGCAATLGECIHLLEFDPAMARKLAENIDAFEEKVDDEYVEVKTLFTQHSETVNAAVLLELRDLANHLESAADMCTDAAESIQIIAAEVL